MKKLGLLWGIAGILGLVVSGRPACAGAADPPLLEPPAVAPLDQARPDPGPELGGPRSSEPAPRKPDVRTSGPPAQTPPEQVGPPPGPDFFYIPGQYVPDGSGAGVAWRPGFWARSQPGWDWVPARWVRLAEGWTYREGHWERSSPVGAVPAPPRRHVVARPAPSPGPTSPFRTPAPAPAPLPGQEGALQGEPNPPTDLTPLPDAGPLATPGPVVPPPAADVPPPAAVVPQPVRPLPPIVGPRIRGGIRLPVTDVFLPGGLHVQVVPGRLPWIGNVPMTPPGVVVPQVQVRPGPTVGDMVRGLIDGTLP
jgi:hypothetical protein